MSRSILNIEKLLKNTGLYKPEDATELKAMEAGFTLLEERLDKLERNLFISTSDGDGLDRREKLLRPSSVKTDESRRRKMLLAWQNIRGDEISMSELSKLLEAVGIEGELLEKREAEIDGATHPCIEVNISALSGVCKEDAARLLEELMPAHLFRKENFWL